MDEKPTLEERYADDILTNNEALNHFSSVVAKLEIGRAHV